MMELCDDLDPRSDGTEQQEKWAAQTRELAQIWEEADEAREWMARACGDVAAVQVAEESPNPDQPARRVVYDELAGWLYAYLRDRLTKLEASEAVAWLMCWTTEDAVRVLDQAEAVFANMGTRPSQGDQE